MSPHLVLFFTRGVSLRTWSMVGMLEREVALYRRLLDHGFQVSFVTYGDATDLDYAESLGDISILCNHTGLPPQEYEDALFSLHSTELESAHVIKTNQMYGADLALKAAGIFKKPLIARCGYMWSWNAEREQGKDSPGAREAGRVEEMVFEGAERVVVTSLSMHADVLKRVPATESRVTVIPNYVDTDLFRPKNTSRTGNSVLFIGRIAPEKNLESLLCAIQPLGLKLTLVGEGKLRPELQETFPEGDGRVRWEGNVPNHELPGYMNSATLFVLPSLYEGHPKVLIEAMACGVPVIGADSPGIRDLIVHRENGYLCGTDPNSIRHAFEELLGDPGLRQRMSANARRFAVENYSLDKIVSMEKAVLMDVIAEE